jgi:hypothetical protein
MDLYWKYDEFLIIHNNCIFPYYGYSIEIVWIYYGFSSAISNLIVWISIFFPVKEKIKKQKCQEPATGHENPNNSGL